MSVRKAELLLAAVIIARSTSLLFVKVGLGMISPFNLIAARFCLAFVILSVIFYKRLLHCNVRDIKCGAALILSGIVLQNVRIKLPEKAHN